MFHMIFGLLLILKLCDNTISKSFWGSKGVFTKTPLVAEGKLTICNS